MDVGGATSKIVRFALDVAEMNHRIMASNIATANMNAAEKVSRHLDFEALMNHFTERSVLGGEDVLQRELNQAEGMVRNGGFIVETSGAVELDLETARIVENAIHYQSLLTALSKRSQIIKAAISEGKI